VYSERTVSDLIGLIYDAAGDPSRWAVFLEKLGRALNSSANNLFVQDLRSQEFSLAAAVGMDPFYHRSYENYYRTRNVYLIRGNHLLRTGSVRLGPAMCPDAIALRSEFYNDWIAPQKQRHGMLGVIFRQRSLTSMVGAIRLKGAELFGADETSLLQSLIPHLQRAIALHRRIAGLEKQKTAAADALDRWSLGVIVLNAQGHVLLMNRKANEIVSQRDGLVLTAGGLHAGLVVETSALRRLIHDAIATRLGHGGQSGGAMTLYRPSLKRSLNVLVTPLFSQNALSVKPEAAVAIFVSDPEVEDGSDEDALQRLYGLTHAEAALAGHLVAGEDLKSSSETLQVSMNTARTHLKRVFEKTRTKRQAELVRLLLQSPAQIRLRP